MQQRGIRERDIRLIEKYGTRVDNDTWLMRNRDAIRQIKNRKVVIRDDRVVTAYPSRRADQKLALRRGRGKGLVK